MPNWQRSHVFNKWNLHIFDDFRLQRINEKYICIHRERERDDDDDRPFHSRCSSSGGSYVWRVLELKFRAGIFTYNRRLNVECSLLMSNKLAIFLISMTPKKHTQTYPPQRNHHISVVCASAAIHDQISIHIESPN